MDRTLDDIRAAANGLILELEEARHAARMRRTEEAYSRMAKLIETEGTPQMNVDQRLLLMGFAAQSADELAVTSGKGDDE